MLRFHSMRVAEIRPDAEDSVAISLEAPPEALHEYQGLPGQHVVLRAETSGAEARRTYSLTSAPGESPLRICVRVHKNGAMSRHLGEDLRVGDTIDVLPPNGSFIPRFSDRRVSVGFAAGCGITPILAVARSVLASGSSFILFYGNTSTARTMCLEDVLALKDRYLDRFAVHFLMSREPQEVDIYNGRLDSEKARRAARVLFDPKEVAECFVCGPGTMIEDVTGALLQCGIQADRIHSEYFAAGVATAGSAADNADRGHQVPGSVARPEQGDRVGSATPDGADVTDVTLVIDGRRRAFTMRRNAETVLDAAGRAGLELPFSCRAGVCSTCRTKVVRGAVEMAENHALEEWELREGYVLACQSRATTPVLELDYDEK